MISGNNITLKNAFSILSHLDYGLMIANIDGEFIYWNSKAEKILQANAQAVQQKDWANFFGVYNSEKTKRYETEDLPLSRALKGEVIHAEKLFLNSPDIPPVYIKVSAYPLLNENNEIREAVVTFEDITHEENVYESIINKINDLEDVIRNLMNKGIRSIINE